MSGANDIANLFARFGGKPEHYQEIARADQARDSEARWPLLSSIGAQAAHPPSVQQGQPRPATGASPFAQPDTQSRTDGRKEPSLPWGAPPPTLDDVVFSAPLTPAAPAEPAPPPAPATAPLSQFIPPRPRGQGQPAPAVRATAQPAAASPGMSPAAPAAASFPLPGAATQPPPVPAKPVGPVPPPTASAATPAALPIPGFGAAVAEPAPAAPLSVLGRASAASSEPTTDAARPAAPPPTSLNTMFERLSRPTPPPESESPPLSLFARLVRR